MRLLLVDDEPLARERLAALLAGMDGIEVAGEAGSGREALELAARTRFDVVLLDIRMPGMDGLAAATELGRLPRPPAIIFCTAYEDHALAAFEANAQDYLLKPVRRERLRTALERVRQRLPQAAAPARRSSLSARLGSELILLPVTEVSHLVAGDKYVTAHHAGGELLLDDSLTALESEFPDLFVRIHRSTLVARTRLAGLVRGPDGGTAVRLDGVDGPLEISRRNLPAVRRLVRSL